MQRVVVIPYRRFERTYRSHLTLNMPPTCCPEMPVSTMNLRWVTLQKNKDNADCLCQNIMLVVHLTGSPVVMLLVEQKLIFVLFKCLELGNVGRRADNITNFMCRLAWNLGASTCWNKASNRNKYQEYFLQGKDGRCVGLTTLPSSCADCLKIWEPQPPGTLKACPGL
jgi:hypothetical protein